LCQRSCAVAVACLLVFAFIIVADADADAVLSEVVILAVFSEVASQINAADNNPENSSSAVTRACGKAYDSIACPD
jgi:hypothetical protein